MYACLRIVVGILLICMLTGCIRIMRAEPVECEADLPLIDYVYTGGAWGPVYPGDGTPFHFPSKENFKSEWGSPDVIKNNSQDEEVWIYNSKIACGYVYVWSMLGPFTPEQCDGFDHVTFIGNIATHIHFRRANSFDSSYSAAEVCPNNISRR